jgi:hypothetical protein
MNVDEIFEPHMIAKSLKLDFQNVINSVEMNEFEERNQYKSAKTRQGDEALVKMLVSKLDKYKNGWVSCNMMMTGELWNKSKLLDEQRKELKYDYKIFNEIINKLIVSIKDRIPEDKLNELRDLERKAKKL